MHAHTARLILLSLLLALNVNAANPITSNSPASPPTSYVMAEKMTIIKPMLDVLQGGATAAIKDVRSRARLAQQLGIAEQPANPSKNSFALLLLAKQLC